MQASDIGSNLDGTEFTVPLLQTYTVVDLEK
jgi:hypothetical protein